jgi:hypothetical protein
VLLTLNENPHAVVASCLGLAASYPASLPDTDTQRIDADEKKDQGNRLSIEDLLQSSNPFAAGSVIGLRQSQCPSCPLQFVLPLHHSSSLKRGRSGWTLSILCASRGKTEGRISLSMHGHLYSVEFRCVNRPPASSFTHVTMASFHSKSLGIPNLGYRRSGQTALVHRSPLGWAEISHPFHPLRGRRFEVLKKRRVAGVDTLILRELERGTLSVPREWTDWADPSPYDSLTLPPHRPARVNSFETLPHGIY